MLLGIEKLLKKKLVVSFTANDLLRSYLEQGKSNLDGFEVKYKDRYDTHFFKLTLNYNFGHLKKTDFSDKSGNKEELQRIGGNK